jgi:protease I
MPQGFQDHEFNVPYKALCDKGYTVDVAGLQPGQASGKLGATFTPNKQLCEMSNIDFDTYDALVIPGGPGSTKYLWNNKDIQKVAHYFYSKKKVVATICYACAVPAQAGLLTGKKATIYPTDEAKKLFSDNGVIFVDHGCEILHDEKVITAQGPQFVRAFAQAIISLLEK